MSIRICIFFSSFISIELNFKLEFDLTISCKKKNCEENSVSTDWIGREKWKYSNRETKVAVIMNVISMRRKKKVGLLQET